MLHSYTLPFISRTKTFFSSRNIQPLFSLASKACLLQKSVRFVFSGVTNMRAEHAAVSAVVAHAVYMNYLRRSVNIYPNICSVRADFAADLADLSARQAPLSILIVFFFVIKNAFRFLISSSVSVVSTDIKSSSMLHFFKDIFCYNFSIRNCFNYCCGTSFCNLRLDIHSLCLFHSSCLLTLYLSRLIPCRNNLHERLLRL